MQKVNRIVKTVVAVLLSLVLITTCLVSGIFAKYVKKGNADFSIKLKEWGVTISSDTDLRKEYTSDGNVVVKSSTSINSGKDNIIMPGSSGRFAYFRINGSPEVAYSVDFSGNINIGDGYTSYIEDAKGNAIEYFPIRFRYVAYDVSTVDGEEVLNEVDALKSPLLTVKRTDAQGNQHYFDEGAWDNVATLETFMNGNTDMGINKALDEPFQAPGVSIDRIYALEWEWLYHYDTEEEVDAGKTENNREPSAEGNYQTRELDTKLGEAILENPELFTITVDMSVSVVQVLSPSYQLFTENGVRKIEFGSYPQSDVTDTMGTTLNEIADTTDSWTSYGYNTGDMRYTDVTLDGEKYRGVYFKTERNTKQSPNGYVAEKVYWFKYEPIRWTIIDRDAETGRVFIFCDLAIDSQPFQSGDVPSGIYKNNYELSTVRTWLNETFYNTAFSELQKQFIVNTEVVNNAESAGNTTDTYICKNTQDNIFLLSYAEAIQYFLENDSRLKKYPTGYALAQGAGKCNGGVIEWWLRSPYTTSSYARAVSDTGNRTYCNSHSSTDMGVLPALWIKL